MHRSGFFGFLLLKLSPEKSRNQQDTNFVISFDVSQVNKPSQVAAADSKPEITRGKRDGPVDGKQLVTDFDDKFSASCTY